MTAELAERRDQVRGRHDMAERPTSLFHAPAGDRPASEAYRPGTWLTEPDPDDGDWEVEAPLPPAAHRYAVPDRRLLLHRLLEVERRLADGQAG
jgi:hypothetical protein